MSIDLSIVSETYSAHDDEEPDERGDVAWFFTEHPNGDPIESAA